MDFPDKCPKCGANCRHRTDVAIRWVCGSVQVLTGFRATDHCNLRCGTPTWRGVNRISRLAGKGE